jgi:hypothetical protein
MNHALVAGVDMVKFAKPGQQNPYREMASARIASIFGPLQWGAESSGLRNVLLFPSPGKVSDRRLGQTNHNRERLGGLLKYHHLEAA